MRATLKDFEFNENLFMALRHRGDGPFNRAEAFIDLLILSINTPRKVVRFGKIYDLEFGQFIGNWNNLAQRWNWPRSNVRRFIVDELCSLGILSYKEHTKCALIKVNGLTFGWRKGESPIDVLQKNADVKNAVEENPSYLDDSLAMSLRRTVDAPRDYTNEDEEGRKIHADRLRIKLADFLCDYVADAAMKSFRESYTPRVERLFLDRLVDVGREDVDTEAATKALKKIEDMVYSAMSALYADILERIVDAM